MSRAIVVLTVSAAELESQLDLVGNVAGFEVGGGGSCDHNGLDDSKGGGIITLDRGSLTP